MTSAHSLSHKDSDIIFFPLNPPRLNECAVVSPCVGPGIIQKRLTPSLIQWSTTGLPTAGVSRCVYMNPRRLVIKISVRIQSTSFKDTYSSPKGSPTATLGLTRTGAEYNRSRPVGDGTVLPVSWWRHESAIVGHVSWIQITPHTFFTFHEYRSHPTPFSRFMNTDHTPHLVHVSWIQITPHTFFSSFFLCSMHEMRH